MLSVAASYIALKNKLHSNDPWLLCLELITTQGTTYRIVNNNEAISWQGQTWEALYFEMPQIAKVDKNGDPGLTIRVDNTGRILQTIAQPLQGLSDSMVNLYLVNAGNLAESTAYLNLSYRVKNSVFDRKYFTLYLGETKLRDLRCPRNLTTKNRCQNPKFKDGSFCRYSGAATECNRSYARCLELNNLADFRAFPSLNKTI